MGSFETAGTLPVIGCASFVMVVEEDSEGSCLGSDVSVSFDLSDSFSFGITLVSKWPVSCVQTRFSTPSSSIVAGVTSRCQTPYPLSSFINILYSLFSPHGVRHRILLTFPGIVFIMERCLKCIKIPGQFTAAS